MFDSSNCYAHNEYELEIMKMFDKFKKAFLREYYQICSKIESMKKYENRVALYELYYYLNHYVNRILY